jgi:heat-inducible transcriptional repressor
MSHPGGRRLRAREREILKLVVQRFIDTAGPVGSVHLSSHFGLGLSPASIRNTMNDLEALGYLGHPHTSAGRIPTEQGYRTFVDELMDTPALTPLQQQTLQLHLERARGDTEALMREGSRLLGQLTNLLGVVLSPRLSTGILERLEVVPLSSTHAMFVVSVRGGLIRTILLHVASELTRTQLDHVVRLLNERLAGLTLEEIRLTCTQRVKDMEDGGTGLIQLVLNESDVLFNEVPDVRRVQFGGAPNLMTQPEFRESSDLMGLMSLMESGGSVIQLLEEQRPPEPDGRASISIGSENLAGGLEDTSIRRVSVVTARYQRGTTTGTVGVIGPTRMDYTHVVALVEGMAALLSWSDPEKPN